MPSKGTGSSIALLMGAILSLTLAPAAHTALVCDGADDLIELPELYAIDLLYAPPLAGLGRIARSDSGEIYLEHAGAGSTRRISMIDLTNRKLVKVLEEEGLAGLAGGPGDTFFTHVNGEIRQVSADGSHTVWGTNAFGPLYFTPDGRMVTVFPDETAVIELFPDGSYQTLLGNLGLAYDVVGVAGGTFFITDLTNGELIRLDPDGSTVLLASIPKDNPNLGFDAAGELYLNVVGVGFVRVDATTGAMTQVEVRNADCSVVLVPSDFAFDNSGHVFFASWAAAALTWVDLPTETGGPLLDVPWANSSRVDIGPDDALYLATDGCGSDPPTRIVRIDRDGLPEVYIGGLGGLVTAIAFDSSGGLYYTQLTEISAEIYYLPFAGTTPTLVPDSLGFETNTLTVDAASDHLLAHVGPFDPTLSEADIAELSLAGLEAVHTVSLPKPATLQLAASPDGTIYGFGTELERLSTGPEVDRWILDLDLAGGTSQIVAQINRIGCCPLDGFSVDPRGVMWWVLNPEFLLYEVSASGATTLFARETPVDAAIAVRNRAADLFLNSPGGVYRIWTADVDTLVDEGFLDQGQANSLQAKLRNAHRKAGQGKTGPAIRILQAFLHQVDAFEQSGILPLAEASALRAAVQDMIDCL